MKKMKKKVLIISLILILVVLLCGISVQAAGQQVQLVGESTISTQTQTMRIKIANDEEVGVIQGYIQGDENIDSIQVAASYNGWTINYNSSNGKFNAFNAVGAKEGEVVEITYSVKNTDQSAKITLKDVELTTISYNTITVSDSVGKEVGAQLIATPTPTPTSGNSQTTTPTPTQVQSIQTNKNDATVNKTPLPQTGVSNTIVISIITVLGIGAISIIRLAIYKNMTKH